MPQEPQDQHSGAGEIDLNKILLPKKETHSVDSAQRIDAGSLYTQEQNATLEPAPPPAPAVPPPTAKKPDGVGPLETYQGDIARVVSDNGVSVVSIAAAEANRRGESPLDSGSINTGSNWLRTGIFVVLGILLLAGGGGALVWYAFFNNAPLPAHTVGAAPFISIDGTSVVQLPVGAGGQAAMDTLVQAKNSVHLSLGLIAQLYVENAATSTGSLPVYEDAPTLLALLAPNIPPTLVRDIEPIYLLGVHSYDTNQPFLILKVDSYEQAYAGMLAWEGSMKTDLAPLFTYVPSPTGNPSPPVQVQVPVASTTNSTSSPQTPQTLPFIQTGFIDQIVDNHDARVLKTADGQIYLLWTFLDRQTIVITTNANTLQEVISRLTVAPITALPSVQ
jgi:hypothetical protein